jgi:[methyl-Co(III) methanol-specific corrinoid protein]:coenzyme M methyltransferase
MAKLDTQKILHICSDATSILKEMVETGANALSVDSPVDIANAKKKVGKRTAIIGNVNTTRVLGTGTVEKVKKEVKEALVKGVDVLSPGCGFSPRTPLVNMKAIKEAALEFYRSTNAK